MIRWIVFFILLLFAFTRTIAQHDFFNIDSVNVEAGKTYLLKPGFSFTSVSVDISIDKNFSGATLSSAEKAEILQEDKHAYNVSKKFSQLFIQTQGMTEIEFYSGEISGKVIFYFHYAPPIKIDYFPSLQKGHNCPKPSDIPQSVWRAGLPAPAGTRTISDVRHVVVHHSAGSNSDTDYVNVVRNIYLYHVNQNGWDDIGYNYVVAQNGSIFKGRDPQGAGDEDNIIGAHYCAKNTGTMGICVLGNYETVAPTNASVASLTDLITWKCAQENMLPEDEELHPKNTGSLLKHVVGHLNGCATECPGDSLYLLLPSIRTEVRQRMFLCAPAAGISSSETAVYVFPNPASDFIYLNTSEKQTLAVIYNLQGQMMHKVPETREIDIRSLEEGIYFLVLTYADRSSVVKFVKDR